MAKRFYIDTSIWCDYFEDRNDGIRPLGLFAHNFLNRGRKKNYVILVSDFCC